MANQQVSFDEIVKYVQTGVIARDPTVIGILVAIGVIFFTVVLLGVLRRSTNLRRAILLVGTCDSGKTSMFCKLIHGDQKTTYTSIKENSGTYKIDDTNKSLRLIDLPGHERLRSQGLDAHKNQARGMIYVIDGATLQKDVKEVAEYLYMLLSDRVISQNALPILIACNKQDQALAKGSKVIKSHLEKEMNTQRVTRSAALQGTDNTANNNTFLGKRNKDFEFSDLKPLKVEFAECSVFGKEDNSSNNLTKIEEWLQKVA